MNDVNLIRPLLTGIVAATLLAAAAPSKGPLIVSGHCSGCNGVPFKLGAIQFVTEQEGWSSAYYWPPGNGSGLSTLLHTTDGGRHWRRPPFVWQQGAESEPPYWFTDSMHGWVGWYDADEFEHRLSWTADGGRSWTHRKSEPLRALQFFDTRTGYSVETTDHGYFFRTSSDGGDTWSRQKLPISSVDLVSFLDSQIGAVVGSDQVPHDRPQWDAVLRVLVTGDGGAHWTQAAAPERPYARAHTFRGSHSVTLSSVGVEPRQEPAPPRGVLSAALAVLPSAFCLLTFRAWGVGIFAPATLLGGLPYI